MNKQPSKNNTEECDSELALFLDFVEQDMVKNPESTTPISKKDLRDIADLVEGVEY